MSSIGNTFIKNIKGSMINCRFSYFEGQQTNTVVTPCQLLNCHSVRRVIHQLVKRFLHISRLELRSLLRVIYDVAEVKKRRAEADPVLNCYYFHYAIQIEPEKLTQQQLMLFKYKKQISFWPNEH